jgi:hypothetical protein
MDVLSFNHVLQATRANSAPLGDADSQPPQQSRAIPRAIV